MPSVFVFGLIVEGDYDERFFSELIPRLLPDVHVEIALVIRAGGTGPLTAKLRGYVNRMRFANSGRAVDGVIVVRDSNGKDPTQIEQILSAQLADTHYRFPRGIVVHAVRRQMETWLLADEAAIGRVVGSPSRTRDPLEEIHDPKAKIRELLSRADRPYTADVCAGIARTLDLEILRTRCPNFRAFEAKLLAS